MQPIHKLDVVRRNIMLALASFALAAPRADAAAMDFRYWDWGQTPKRDDYLFAALKLGLEKSSPAYGPYTVTRVQDTLSTFRVRREVYLGKRLNVHAGPWRDVAAGDPMERNFLISTPIMGGLLGYRSPVVRKEDLPKFKAIRSPEQLKLLTAGMGRGWIDAGILRANGYPVVDSGNITSLLQMLLNKRFDYLPLSVAEAATLLTKNAPLTDGLAIVPDLVMYYPFPLVLYVSANEPKLAQRLEAGMAAAKRDGSLDELTARYYQAEFKQLKAAGLRCFVLANPLLPETYASEPPLLTRRSGSGQP